MMKLCIVLPFVAQFVVACGSLPPGAVQAGVATVETAICIMNVASKDAGQPPAQVVADAIQQCATDAATIARVLDSQHALALRECSSADAGQ